MEDKQDAYYNDGCHLTESKRGNINVVLMQFGVDVGKVQKEGQWNRWYI